MYDKGQKNEAIDIFMKTTIGTNYRDNSKCFTF